MAHTILTKISFFSSLLLGLCILSWCTAQPSVAPIQQRSPTSVTQQHVQSPMIAHQQKKIHTTTRAS